MIQPVDQNVGWKITIEVHNGGMDPIKVDIWPTHEDVMLEEVGFITKSTTQRIRVIGDVLPGFGGGAQVTDLPGGFPVNSPLTVSVTVLCVKCYNPGAGNRNFSWPSTGSYEISGP